MRIAITGASCQGKSTLIQDMLKEWPEMSTPNESYRDILKSKKKAHSKQTDEDVQWDILNHMCDTQQQYRNNDKIIFDRCPIDNIVYSMWSNFHGNISDDFIEKCIPIVRESMRFIDIIFTLPITASAPVEIEDDGIRETDKHYIEEIDQLIKTMYRQWQSDTSPFFPKNDKPAMIEIFGNRQERIEMIKLYIDADGDAIGEGGILDPGEIEQLEKLFGLQ
jgi:predicted ATPase